MWHFGNQGSASAMKKVVQVAMREGVCICICVHVRAHTCVCVYVCVLMLHVFA